MFRLYYCCGMRNNEVCTLETADVDLGKGIITVRSGKNQKDRLVYLSEDLRVLMERYLAYLTKELGYLPFYFFPGRLPDGPMTKGNLDKRFNAFWNATESSSVCDKKPTLHCLRHTFVLNRLNQWIMNDVDLSGRSSLCYGAVKDPRNHREGRRNQSPSFFPRHVKTWCT